MTVWGATWWDAAQAVGTVGVVIVAVGLALREGRKARKAEASLESERLLHSQQERISAASLVSAWTETKYERSGDGTHYLRRVMLHLANESNEPVFNAYVVVGVGQPVVQIGPLAAPVPIPVLPARRHRSWDISMGVLGHTKGMAMPAEPVTKLRFTDSKGIRWKRDFEGVLSEQVKGNPEPLPTEADGIAQMGDPTNAFNPIWIVAEFYDLVMAEVGPTTVSRLKPYLSEAAPGWSAIDDVQIEAWREELADFGIAPHVSYPAPHVAYVRLVHEADHERLPSQAGYIQVRAEMVTLVFFAGIGRKIFSIGPGVDAPDWIEFPVGALADDPRG